MQKPKSDKPVTEVPLTRPRPHTIGIPSAAFVELHALVDELSVMGLGLLPDFARQVIEDASLGVGPFTNGTVTALAYRVLHAQIEAWKQGAPPPAAGSKKPAKGRGDG